MKRVVISLLLIIFSSARAGTSDPGGIAVGIFWLLAIACCLWAVVSFAVGRTLGSSSLRRALIGSALAAAPLAYCSFTSYQFDSGLNDLRALNEEQTASANAYLLQVCAAERRQSARPIAPSGGVFIDVDARRRLNLENAPPPPKETRRMKRDQERYGESYPVETHKLQYETPAYWVQQFNADSVLIESHFEFVESPDALSNIRNVRTVARKHWWMVSGRMQVSEDERQELERRLANLPEAENYWLSERVTASRAKYVVSAQDVSTTEDRKHWVARARIVLTERKSGEVFAEYVGFAANQAPAYRPGESYPWERLKVCPGKEQSYVRERTPWNVIGFFFREVVSYQGA